MKHRLLLGSTALVGAGVLLAGAASAQENGFEVKLSGFTEFGARFATEDTGSNGSGDRGYNFFMDNEVHINARATHNNVTYGSKVELEVGSSDSDNVSIDEIGLFFSGGFGRVELGKDDGAEDVMYVGGEDAQAGTGGIDGDTQNLNGPQFGDTGDNLKATYFTPRLAGFQLGASFTPAIPQDSSGNDQNPNELEKSIGAGVNWVGVLGPVDLTLSGVYLYAKANDDTPAQDNDDVNNWAIGGLLGFGGFTLGAGYNSEKAITRESNIYNLGLKYGFGPANVSVGYTYRDYKAATGDIVDDSNLIAVSGDMGLMPGVTLKADVTYNSDTLNSKDPGDSSYAGVLTMQLDY